MKPDACIFRLNRLQQPESYDFSAEIRDSIQQAFHKRDERSTLMPGDYFSEVPFVDMEGAEKNAYMDLFCEMMRVVDFYLESSIKGLPVQKIDELMRVLQIECVEPFLSGRASDIGNNDLIWNLGNHERAHGAVTILGTNIPVQIGKTVYNYYLKQMMLVNSCMNEEGVRVPTGLPPHAHAANVGYSHAMIPHSEHGATTGIMREDMYCLVTNTNEESAILENGTMHPLLLRKDNQPLENKIKAKFVESSDIQLSSTPESFLETALPEHQLGLDRFQRPHAIQAIADTTESSPVNMPTYFGADARTTLFAV